jgi:DNA-binding CsgD family transcriptional regulator
MSSINHLMLWHKTLASVIEKNFNSEAIAELLKGLEQLVHGSSGLVTIFPVCQPPQTTHHRLLANEDPMFQVDAYDSGAYLLDPFYRIAIDEKVAGAFTLKDVSPEGFEESEYYNLFYKKLGFSDEICMLFQLDDDSIISISLVRHIGEEPFRTGNTKQLNIVYPLVKSILTEWRKYLIQSDRPNLEYQLDNALVKFGSSVLTPREGKILHLILHGYSIKHIAEKLENSLETIKHHRKNIYIKLDVSSQSELFYLFIASLKAMSEGARGDPLTFLD